MSVVLRAATVADAETIAGLMERGFTDTFGHLYAPEDLAAFLGGLTLARWRAELADPAFAFLVAEVDGIPAGFAKLGPHSLPVEPQGPMIELRQLYVLKAHHGAGLAPRMMDWTIAEARRRGARELFLSVFVENARARRFYERYGFERIGDYVFMVGNHEDHDDLMRLAL